MGKKEVWETPEEAYKRLKKEKDKKKEPKKGKKKS